MKDNESDPPPPPQQRAKEAALYRASRHHELVELHRKNWDEFWAKNPQHAPKP